MKFLEKLFSSEQGSSLHPAVAQVEREAIIDLLLLAIYVDNHLSLGESGVFGQGSGGAQSVADENVIESREDQ